MITSVLDVSHYEQGADIGAAVAAGDCAALITQTTFGLSWVDPTAAGFILEAHAADVPCGEYHFADGNGDGALQADHFRKHRNPRSRAILDLEWCHTSHGPMTIENAERFVLRMEDKEAETPMLYTSRYFVGARISPRSPLARCKLWVPAYGDHPQLPIPFNEWKLWQYTDGKFGPHDQSKFPRTTRGLGRHCDRSAFDGTADQLRALLTPR